MTTRPFTKLVDGGYVSFVYGSRAVEAWFTNARATFSDHLVCMDSRSIRSELYPKYKSRRSTRKENDPIKMATYQQVQELRRQMIADPQTNTVQVAGAEADDLIGILVCVSESKPGNKNPITEVVGLDKDLQQLPGISDIMRDLSGTNPLASSSQKWPKYVLETVEKKSPTPLSYRASIGKHRTLNEPVIPVLDWVYTQALMGDRSDSIPRLLSSVGSVAKQTWISVTTDWEDRYEAAYAQFGQAFMVNLKLAAIPYYAFSPKWINAPDQELLAAFAHGSYWRLGWKDAALRIATAIEDGKPKLSDFGW